MLSAVYAAVATTTTLAGCPVLPASSAFNEDVSKAPVDPRSETWMASMQASSRRVHPDFGTTYGIPITIVRKDQKKVPVRFDAFPNESDPGPYPIPANARIEAGSDRHVIVLQRGTCRLYELYAARRNGSGWVADSGAVFDLKSTKQRPLGWTSADAAGLPILPGLARPEQRVTHALRFTAPRTQKAFVAPARHHAGASTDPALPPMGLRIRLKASFSLRGYTGQALTILVGLKRYGAILADNGSPFFFSGARDPRWDDANLEQLKRVPATAFEAVKAGKLRR